MRLLGKVIPSPFLSLFADAMMSWEYHNLPGSSRKIHWRYTQ
jgi:hypothetical protein